MLVVTTLAVRDRSLFDVGQALLNDPWFHATLLDAYCGFLTFYVWVAYKEPGVWRKVVWFVLIMTLGNFAMSIYVLFQILSAAPDRPLESILLRKASSG